MGFLVQIRASRQGKICRPQDSTFEGKPVPAFFFSVNEINQYACQTPGHSPLGCFRQVMQSIFAGLIKSWQVKLVWAKVPSTPTRRKKMRVVDAIAEILKREGVEYLICFPTAPMIEAAASAGIRPVVCRQERVGVGIADGFSRVSNGRRIGVFAMQAGPGTENAFAGVGTAFSHSVPILVLPAGNARNVAQTFPFFRAVRSYAAVTKWVEELILPEQTPEVMRRAFSLLKMGRRGPVMIELPADVATAEFPGAEIQYRPVKAARSAPDPHNIEEAAKTLAGAKNPLICAGQGVLYAEASADLVELAEMLEAPVMTTLEGKSAFSEDHPLALGTGAGVAPMYVHQFLRQSDVVFAIGCSLTHHGITFAGIPPGKTIIHAT